MADGDAAPKSSGAFGDELGQGTVGGAKGAVKLLARALENGMRVSDQDYKAVASTNLGLLPSLDAKLMNLKDGEIIPNAIRQELEQMFSVLEVSGRESYARRVGRYNNEMKTQLGKEWRPELALPTLPRFTGKQQNKLIHSADALSRDTVSSHVVEDYFRDPQDGSLVLDDYGKAIPIRKRLNPVTKQWDIIE